MGAVNSPSIRWLSAGVLVTWLASCGGGGGGGESGSGSGSGSVTTAEVSGPLLSLSSDCAGSSCSSQAINSQNIYTGNSIGIWRYYNSDDNDLTGSIRISGLPVGKNIVILQSGGTTSSAKSPGYEALYMAGAGTATSFNLQSESYTANSAAALSEHTEESHLDTHHHIIRKNQSILELVNDDKIAFYNTTGNHTPMASQAQDFSMTPSRSVEGDSRAWNENAFSGSLVQTTAQLKCSIPSGRNIIFWVQNGIYKTTQGSAGTVTQADLLAYQNAVCGENGRFEKIISLLGDVWGSNIPTTSQYARIGIRESSQQKLDINIVLIDGLSASTASKSGWGGYFYGINNVIKTTNSNFSKSNEALVIFINTRQSQGSIKSVLIHEFTHMINYYQRNVLRENRHHETWLEETAAMMTQDIFDDTTQNNTTECNSISPCYLRKYIAGDGFSTYRNGGGGIQYLNWPSTTLSYGHYYMAGGFAAYLNRQYGLNIYTQLTTECNSPPASTSSYACLDYLIQKNGGNSLMVDFARYGASAFALLGGTAPSAYGFPRKTGVLQPSGNVRSNFAYDLVALENWWNTPSPIKASNATATTTTSQLTHVYQVDTMTNTSGVYVRNNIRIPAKATLIVVAN